MGEPSTYQETIDYLRHYADEDWLELSAVVDWANHVTGRDSTITQIGEMTLRLAEDLVTGGAVPGDLVADDRDFVPWPGNRREQMDRLRSELSDLMGDGRLPESVDICWFHHVPDQDV